MDGILQMIQRQEVWEDFLAYRLRKGRFTWRSFVEADEFVEAREYLPAALRISRGENLSIPIRATVNKMGSGKKRIVYHFEPDEMVVLKLISYLLYRYDDRFAPNCYSFRRGIRACDAIFNLNRELRGRSMWAYKVDIHDYFNSISIHVLLPILKELMSDDQELFGFFENYLSEERSREGDTVIIGGRGVMAGTPTAPFLADVYLMEVDRYFHDIGVIYARYSDDIIIFAEDYDSLMSHKETLIGFFKKYHLEVNPSKEKVYSPDEPFEFLGFRCRRREIDISKATIEKMKGKIRRRAHSLNRWISKSGNDPVYAMKSLVNTFNKKFFESDDPGSLSWSRWFFPVINRTEGLAEIDHFLQDNIRYLYSGKHNKGNFRVRYEDLKALGYRSLVHEYYTFTTSQCGPNLSKDARSSISRSSG